MNYNTYAGTMKQNIYKIKNCFMQKSMQLKRSCVFLSLLVTMFHVGFATDIQEVIVLADNILLIRFDDGRANYHSLGNRRNQETMTVNALNIGNAGNKLSYTISSTNDGNYSTAKNPTDIGRKSKGTEYINICESWGPGCRNTSPDHAKEHWIYLYLPTALQNGKTYTVNTGNLAVNGSSWTFTYDYNSTRSEAIHVNNLGYLPTATAKYGYLSYWAGDKGGLDLSTYNGKPFRLIRTSDGSTAFSGVVNFRLPKTAQEAGTTGETPLNNYWGADVYECNFSSFNAVGEYRLAIDGIGCSFPFKIGPDALFDAYYWTMKAGLRSVLRMPQLPEMLPIIQHKPQVSAVV
jgi:endoglucanase